METDHLKWLFGYLRLAIGFKKTSFGRIYRNTSFTNFFVMNGPTEELTFAIGKSIKPAFTLPCLQLKQIQPILFDH
jgi:hypothetical protein